MNLSHERQQLEQLVDQHTQWRAGCLNLIAAENVMSPQARRFLSCDLAQRYGDYAGRDLRARKYFGNRFTVQIEEYISSLARQVFDCSCVELRPLSGHTAGCAVVGGLVQPGDVVLELGPIHGGHRIAKKFTVTSVVHLDVRFLPFDYRTYNVDVPGAIELIRRARPRLVILGSSLFLFPHPVRRLSAVTRDLPNTTLAYDASHVLGLIAGGEFQDPLREGADVVFGSTHKTFPGPQGGVILSNNGDLMERVSEALYPGLVTNHHLARMPSLGVSLLEMKRWGMAYATQVVCNAKALAAEIFRRGIDVVGSDQGYTSSHTILVQTQRLGDAEVLGAELEEAGIIVSTVKLPPELGYAGLRLGLAEITRLGAIEKDMDGIAELITDVLLALRPPAEVRDCVADLVAQFQDCCYC